MRTPISLVCLDMAGTTIEDTGSVLAAFRSALPAAGLRQDTPEYDAALRYALDTMGQSKIEVFRALTGGDEERATRGNSAFERAYAQALETDGVRAVPGAADAIEALRSAGRTVALTTGFAPATRDRLLDTLGWRDLVSLALSPADAGRGRPWPDMLLTAVLRTGTRSVAELAAVGDTTSDLLAGHRAGAGFVAAVRTGAHRDTDFAEVPHTVIVDSVADIPSALDAHDRGDAA